MGQCRTFEFTGIVLDTLRENAPLLRSLAEHLASAAKRGGLHLYVPESLADIDDSVSVIITSAVSGGTSLQRLSDGAACYGKERLALEIERLRMDFLLPARNGCGTVLTAEELKALMEKHRARTFFSTNSPPIISTTGQKTMPISSCSTTAPAFGTSCPWLKNGH
jgi:hypothetical protein